jgi:predicted dehydrogenase
MNRRQFISTSAAALTASSLPSFGDEFSAMKKRVGLIGTGWYGKCDLLRLIQVAPVDVVSLCDVDKTMLSDAADLVATRQLSKKRPRVYEDYREMLKEKDLDIVLVGTPDHWHALNTIDAIKAGADVYCQKPTGVDIVESQAMLAAARKYQRVVQVGTQRRSTPHLIEAKNDIIKSGKLGKVGMVEVYCYYHMRAKGNPPNSEAPANLNYDLWSGPAPLLPWNEMRHPRKWRAFMEYGNGIVGDMCVHMLDMVRWMLDLGSPGSIASTGGILVDKGSIANITDTQTATFDFDGLPVIWQHRSYGEAPDPKYPWGATIYGENGTLKASVQSFDFIPRGGKNPVHRDVTYELEQYPEDQTEKDLEKHVAPAIRGHMRDFLRSIANRSKPVADIEEAHISSTACILANLSQKLGRSLKWDAAAGKIVGDEAATALMARPYRAPWLHPDPLTV